MNSTDVVSLPPVIEDILHRCSGSVVLAGGAMRDMLIGEEPKDFDFWLQTGTDVEAVQQEVLDACHGADYRIVETPNARSIKLPDVGLDIQLVTRWRFENIDHLFEQFDFRCCRAAMWAGPNGVLCSRVDDDVREDCMKMRLVYDPPFHRDELDWGSLFRAFRLVGRGWTIDDESILGIAARAVVGDGCVWEATKNGLLVKLMYYKDNCDVRVLAASKDDQLTLY